MADEAPRWPHHAALFAYTRWTNIFSPSKFVFWGDQVSGPLAATFGPISNAGHQIKGIKDIQVMPGLDKHGNVRAKEKHVLGAHTKYWSWKQKGQNPDDKPPYHIKVLREALKLKLD